MKKIRPAIKWGVLIGLILLGLMYLKDAFIFTLLSSATTCADPLVWRHRSIVYLGYGLACISTSIMLFVILKDEVSFKNYKIILVWLAFLLACLIYPEFKEWLEIDRCLDSGGKWSAEYFECSI